MKSCDKCGSTRIVRYSSMNKLQCGDCGHVMVWNLKEGQQPLLGNNRQKTQGNK